MTTPLLDEMLAGVTDIWDSHDNDKYVTRLEAALELALVALELANYDNDYYLDKPHKATELVYSNREAQSEIKKILRGEE